MAPVRLDSVGEGKSLLAFPRGFCCPGGQARDEASLASKFDEVPARLRRLLGASGSHPLNRAAVVGKIRLSLSRHVSGLVQERKSIMHNT